MRRPVSRVLSSDCSSDGHSSRSAVTHALEQPTRSVLIEVGAPRCLFGLAPAGVCRAATVASRAVSSYLTVSPLPVLRRTGAIGGLLSVALSVGRIAAPPRRYLAARPMEPGLSSSACTTRDHPAGSIHVQDNLSRRRADCGLMTRRRPNDSRLVASGTSSPRRVPAPPHHCPGGRTMSPRCRKHSTRSAAHRHAAHPERATRASMRRARAATGRCIATSVDDLIHDLKSRPRAGGARFRQLCCDHSPARVASLVREFPRVPAVALLTSSSCARRMPCSRSASAGSGGLVDVRQPAGWRELRGALMADTGDGGQRGILGQLAIDLAGVPRDCWRFFETTLHLLHRASGNVRLLSRHLDVLPSTLMSRFFRAGLPHRSAISRWRASSAQLASSRIPASPSRMSRTTSTISSPQSFGRHVRTLLHMTAGDFRHQYDGMGMFERFRQELMLPYLSVLRELRPLTAPPGWVAAHGEHRRSRGVAPRRPCP